MGRRSAILGAVALATAGVATLAWRVGADGDGGRASLDLAPPRVLAAEAPARPDGRAGALLRAPSWGPALAADRNTLPDLVPDRDAVEAAAAAHGRVAVARPTRFEIAAPGRVGADGAVDGSEVPTGLLRVRAVATPEGGAQPAPLAGVRVAAYVPGEARVTVPVDDRAGDLDRSPRSGADGTVELVLPAGVDVRLVSTGDGIGARSGSLAVAALADGETREMDLHVETLAGQLVEVRLVDAASGSPIAGAELRRAPPRGTAEPAESWAAGGALLARCDEDGAAVLSRAELVGERIRIVAVDYGPAWFDPASLGEGATFRLQRAAQLEVRVALTAPEDSAAVVRLSTPAAYLSLAGETSPDDPVVDRPVVEWRMHLDLGGRTRFDALPAGVPLTLDVELRDELRHRAARPIVLEPGGAAEHEVALGAGVLLHGALRGPDGRAFAGTEVWLVAASERGPAFLDAADTSRRVAGRATTNAAGEFELAAVPAGEWWVGPAPPLENGDPRAPAPFARWIRVPADGGAFGLDLQASSGLFLEGLVRDGDGGAPDVTVEARLAGTGAHTAGRSDDAGRFRIGPLAPGTYEVAARADARARHSGSRALFARPGDPVELELLPGGVLVVHGFGAEGVSAPLGQVRWTRSDVGPFASGEHRVEEGAYSVLVSGLDKGTYDLFAQAADGRVGTAVGVRVAGARPRRDVRVPLQPAARLTLRNGAAEPLSYEVFLGRCSLAAGELAPEEDALLLAPPGDLVIRHAAGDLAPTEVRRTLARDAEQRVVLRGPAR